MTELLAQLRDELSQAERRMEVSYDWGYASGLRKAIALLEEVARD